MRFPVTLLLENESVSKEEGRMLIFWTSDIQTFYLGVKPPSKKKQKKSPHITEATRSCFCSTEQKRFCVFFYFLGQFFVRFVGFKSLIERFSTLCAIFFKIHTNDL